MYYIQREQNSTGYATLMDIIYQEEIGHHFGMHCHVS